MTCDRYCSGLARKIGWSAVFLLACRLSVFSQAPQSDVTVKVALGSQEVFLGESIPFQIQISGSDKPEQPDMSPVAGSFAVQGTGSGQNNSESISIVNGRTTHTVFRGYTFSYSLTPKRAGDLVLPSISVTVEGRPYQTAPVRIRVKQPAETDDFKFRASLSKSRCYVGEPLVLTMTWYMGKDAQSIQFIVPALEDDASFSFGDKQPVLPGGTQTFSIPLPGGNVVGVEGQGSLDGHTYRTITFHKVLIPKRTGVIELPASMAVCDALVGYRQGGSPLDDFFSSPIFNQRRGVFQKVSVASAPLKLTVMGLPEQGRPAHFAGPVGEYRIEASASPMTVSVGDPITLKIAISASEYVAGVNLPPLEDQPAISADFKIPAEIAPGVVDGNRKMFTQTVRATRSDINQIPPIELAYFDTKAGEYRIAKSKPIPLNVKETKIVTVIDAEGNDAAPVGSALEAWSKGIAHNYEGEAVLENHRYGPDTWIKSPAWLSLIGAPPVLFTGLLLTTVFVRRRNSDPSAMRARRARAAFLRNASALLHTEKSDAELHSRLLEYLRTYLGDRLRLPSAALSYADVENHLKTSGVTEETLKSLRAVFTRCEASSYAGSSGSEEPVRDLIGQARHIVSSLDRKLNRYR